MPISLSIVIYGKGINSYQDLQKTEEDEAFGLNRAQQLLDRIFYIFRKKSQRRRQKTGFSKKEIRELIETLPMLNRDILERSEDRLDREEIGLNYDEDMYWKKCQFILEYIPDNESISYQVAYLIRAFMCAQMFKEGNKRTSILLTETLIRAKGFKPIASNKDIWDFIKYRVMDCPQIPISNKQIVSKDSLFVAIEKWIKEKIVYIH